MALGSTEASGRSVSGPSVARGAVSLPATSLPPCQELLAPGWASTDGVVEHSPRRACAPASVHVQSPTRGFTHPRLEPAMQSVSYRFCL